MANNNVQASNAINATPSSRILRSGATGRTGASPEGTPSGVIPVGSPTPMAIGRGQAGRGRGSSAGGGITSGQATQRPVLGRGRGSGRGSGGGARETQHHELSRGNGRGLGYTTVGSGQGQGGRGGRGQRGGRGRGGRGGMYGRGEEGERRAARMTSTRGGANQDRVRDPVGTRCHVSARHTNHEGPVYGAVEGTMGETSMVRYTDTDLMEKVAEIHTNRLTTGEGVEREMRNGRPVELRYRCYLAPVEEGSVSVWRLVQVERTDEDEEERGLFWIHYRPKGHDGMLLTSTVEEFRDTTMWVTKEDFILDVGDWSQTDISLWDLQDSMEATNRDEVRRQHPLHHRIRMMSRLGLMEWVTLESFMRLNHMDTGMLAGGISEREVRAPRVQGIPRAPPVEPMEQELARVDVGAVTTPGTFHYTPTFDGLASRSLAAEIPEAPTYCKYDYNPRRNCRHRSTLIFAGGEYELIGTTPGDQLESLRGQEIIPSPGSDIDLIHCTWGFSWGELPLGISNVRFVGGGQSRKIEEPNINKAITATMKRRNLVITTMADLGNSTLQMSATARRWYRYEIVEILVILDEYARKAQMTEGANAPKQIVGAYVALVEIALRVVCTALNSMSMETYKADIVAARTRVRRTIALNSETFQLTVGVARTAEYHSRYQGRGGGGGNAAHQGDAKKQRVGGERPGNKVPGNVVAALKNKDGRSLCLGFLSDKCTRKEGTCRFVHEPLPDGVAQEVLDWISQQDGKKT